MKRNRNTARPGRLSRILLLAALCQWFPASLHAEEILVAVAANFLAPMTELARQFEVATGHELVLTSGASGRFVAQITNGAPFQVFLSADQDKPDALAAAGLTVPGSQFTYAVGALMLWSADPNMTDIGPQSLLQPSVRAIALANPRLAPYGRAAAETLDSLELSAGTRSRWVQGENIAQTFQFVDSGNAQLGFVARSQVLARGAAAMARAWLVPTELHSPIRQDAVLLKTAADCQACRDLLAYLQSAPARELIANFGYDLP